MKLNRDTLFIFSLRFLFALKKVLLIPSSVNLAHPSDEVDFNEDELKKPIEQPVLIGISVNPCECPCPVGIEAIVSVTYFGITFIDKTSVKAGDLTGIAVDRPEQSFHLEYNFQNEKQMGMINNLSVKVSYKLTFYYKNSLPVNCCEYGKIKFRGVVNFNGTTSPFFGNPESVSNQKAQVKTDEKFDFCGGAGEEQCQITFKGSFDKPFSPYIPGWKKDDFTLKGIFTVDVQTKKSS